MPRPVHIHAGAHRTGTSSFQLCLAENCDVLDRAGYDVAYPGRDGVPGGRLKLRLPGPRHGAGQMAGLLRRTTDALVNACPDRGRPLILSEENIPGRMFHFYSGRFYPASAARFRTLAEALGQPPARVIYVVRPYSQLYPSAYRKRAEDNAVAPFARIVPALLAMDRGWPELLTEMRDILNPREFVVVTYQQRGASRDLLRRLVPALEQVDLAEPEAVLNLSASDAALDILQRKYHAKETLGRAEWRRIITENRDNRQPAGFADLGPAEAGAMDSRYARDMKRIAGMAGITLIGSAPPP